MLLAQPVPGSRGRRQNQSWYRPQHRHAVIQPAGLAPRPVQNHDAIRRRLTRIQGHTGSIRPQETRPRSHQQFIIKGRKPNAIATPAGNNSCVRHRQGCQTAGVTPPPGLPDMPQDQEFRPRLHRGQNGADADFPAQVADQAVAVVSAGPRDKLFLS